MKITFILILFLIVGNIQAQTSRVQEYFSLENKAQAIPQYENLLLRGCGKSLEKQPAAPDISLRVDQVKKTLESKFSQAFKENPKIKEALDKDLAAIAGDSSCLEEGNNCRVKLVATAHYYFQNLRPDISRCEEKNLCQDEKKFRQTSLSSFSRGGPTERYTKELVNELNRTTDKILKDVLHVSLGKKKVKKGVYEEIKDPVHVYICDKVPYGVVFQYPLQVALFRDYYSGIEPGKKVVEVKKETTPCVEEKMTLFSDVVPTNFGEGRSTVDVREVDPLKETIMRFVNDPSMVVTDVVVTSSSSRTPFHIGTGKFRKIDPNSDKRNLDLAQQRSDFASKELDKMAKASPSRFSKISIRMNKPELAGPEFKPTDLNGRFVTNQSPDFYKSKIEELYQQNKKLYESQAMIKSSEELLNQDKFKSLYEAKFKAFQGFRVQITGHKKETMKCGGSIGGVSGGSSGGSSGSGSNQ